MAYTRTQIRQRVGSVEFAADTIASTETAIGSTSTLADATLKQGDDFFNFSQIAFTSGTNNGSLRYVTDWVQSTSTFTLDRTLTTAGTIGDTYEINRLFSYTDKNAAINAAIRAAGSRWTRNVEDTSLTLDIDTYTYSCAAFTIPLVRELGIDNLLYDTNITGTGYPFADIHPSFWELRWSSAGVPTIQFLTRPPIDNETLRVVYRALPSQLATDAATLDPDTDAFYNYVCAKATAILYRAKSNVEPEGDWGDKAQKMEELAELFFDLEKPQAPAKPIRNTFLMWG